MRSLIKTSKITSMKKIRIKSESDQYQFSIGKIGDICIVNYEFDDIYIVCRIEHDHTSHAFAVRKQDTESI